jgi:magnesium-transporting ATPase (P-type)
VPARPDATNVGFGPGHRQIEMTPRLRWKGEIPVATETVAQAPVQVAHAQPAATVLTQLDVDPALGLDPADAQRRLQLHGANRLPPATRRTALMRFLLQFHNPLIYVLFAAGVATFWLEHYVDAGVIFGVVVVNAIIGYVQEGKAERALDAVRAMLASHAVVLRGAERHEIDAADLVPGDIVLVESGTKVPADLRLFHARNLRVNEAALTGESLPAEKSVAEVGEAAPIGDRACMAYSGTVVTYGQGRGVVVGTGAATELGRIGTLVSTVETLATPLTRRLDQFARQITAFILVVGLFTFLYGYYVTGMQPMELFLAVVGLAVAAIPEGLPAIVTITLAIGATAMAKSRAILRRLPAVETLGSVTVICSDKTGTLTRNEMTAVAVLLPGRTLSVTGTGYAPDGGFREGGAPVDPERSPELLELCRCGLLCNDARVHAAAADEWTLVGDPTEGALVTLALKAGLDPHVEREATPRRDEVPFESERCYMATLHHDHHGNAFAYLKGAPERVLALCVRDADGATLDVEAWSQRMIEAAGDGLRLLALARADLPCGTGALELQDDVAPRYTLLGLVGMIDPPRPEAIAAVQECRRAGVRVKMVTGDHLVTAAAIGRQLGLDADHALSGAELDQLDDAELGRRVRDTDVIARASPEHKLRLVAALQRQGELVAMTGDGVNDAPALKAADIGVAMGCRGTDAAREAADLVLTDDNFATIAEAVRGGRVVFDNIKKSLLFVLPTNGGEAGVILLAVFAGMSLPVTAAQILWVNMVTTVTLAIAIAFEPAERGVMSRPPRAVGEPLITRLLFGRIAYVTLLMIAVTFIVHDWELARGASIETARTAAVNMLVIGEMVYLFNIRHFTDHAFSRDTVYGNPVAFWASLSLLGMQALFTYAPAMQQLFRTAALDAASWTLILSLGLAKFVAVEAEKWVLRRLGVRSL